ncbi:hypothetical protein J6590_025803 [Homalodisca vitripennis]|nr:hypothetical protein J6590_025803 [Homalodisca vitripennis]
MASKRKHITITLKDRLDDLRTVTQESMEECEEEGSGDENLIDRVGATHRRDCLPPDLFIHKFVEFRLTTNAQVFVITHNEQPYGVLRNGLSHKKFVSCLRQLILSSLSQELKPPPSTPDLNSCLSLSQPSTSFNERKDGPTDVPDMMEMRSFPPLPASAAVNLSSDQQVMDVETGDSLNMEDDALNMPHESSESVVGFRKSVLNISSEVGELSDIDPLLGSSTPEAAMSSVHRKNFLEKELNKNNNEPGLAVEDRVALACLYLSNARLYEYLSQLTETLISSGDLGGVLLTGAGSECVSLLQHYLDRSGDVQSACLIAACTFPSQLLDKDSQVQEWIASYRNLLNSWHMWNHRARVDIALSTRNPGTKPVQQVFVSCNFCGKSVSAYMQASSLSRGQLARLGATSNRLKMTSCPNCRKPQPRCAVCLVNMGTPAYYDGNPSPSPSRPSTTPLRLSPFNSWYTWCQTCRHGGHASHITQWFRLYNGVSASHCWSFFFNAEGGFSFIDCGSILNSFAPAYLYEGFFEKMEVLWGTFGVPSDGLLLSLPEPGHF